MTTFILMSDCEEVFSGTFQKCVDYYKKLPAPLPFRIYEITKIYFIGRDFGKRIIKIEEAIK